MAKKAWDRQKGETDYAYLAFKCYLELGEGNRSVQKAWDVYVERRGLTGSMPSHGFNRWSFENDWRDRASAWDQHLWNIRLEQSEINILKARAILREGAEGAARTLYRVGQGEDIHTQAEVDEAIENDIHLLNPSVAVSAAKEVLDRVGVIKPNKLELTGRDGGPVESKVKLDLSKLSKDELRILAALRAKATAEEEDDDEG